MKMAVGICEIPPEMQLLASFDALQLDPFLEQRVEKIWLDEKKRLGEKLFDGSLLSFQHFSEKAIVGKWLAYKLYTAQKVDPNLQSVLQIEAMGVMGLVHCPGFCLLGQRADFVMNYPSMFEIAPSGTLSYDVCQNFRDGHERQILQELLEETGIRPSMIEDVKTFALVKDSATCIIDLCVSLFLKAPVELCHNDEYTKLWWQSTNDLAHFLEHNSNFFVPSSLAVLDFAQRKNWKNLSMPSKHV